MVLKSHLAEIFYGQIMGKMPELLWTYLKLLRTEKLVVMGYLGLRWTSEYGTLRTSNPPVGGSNPSEGTI